MDHDFSDKVRAAWRKQVAAHQALVDAVGDHPCDCPVELPDDYEYDDEEDEDDD